VVARALGLLEERDLADSDPAIAKELADFRAKVQVGIDDLRNGRYKVYSKENRQELLDDIKRRALKLEAERTQPHDV
jgi:biotin operon repressor